MKALLQFLNFFFAKMRKPQRQNTPGAHYTIPATPEVAPEAATEVAAPKPETPSKPPVEPQTTYLPKSASFPKDKIQKIINVFETGSIVTNYSSVFVFADGPNSIRQITLARGFTEFGNLKAVVERYAAANGVYSSQFKSYVGRIGKQPSLNGNKLFTDLLKKAGECPVMRQIQDDVFDERYWIPANKFFKDNGFKENLSLLVIFDSYLHSGSILGFLRKRFSERPPSGGGSEKKWIEQYVNTRHNWLATHSRTILRGTVYRTNCFKQQIASGNWDLTQPVRANGTLVA